MTIPTPAYNLTSYPDVYEPSEDTFLFIDALESDLAYLQKLHPLKAVEIGSGSGIVITALSTILGSKCAYFATDINPAACDATKNTCNLNKTNVDCLNANLLDCFKSEFDLILFNPPYVVTGGEEIAGNGLNRAWAGGENGREIIDNLLVNLRNLLSDHGVCYMVLLKENKPSEVVDLLKRFGFASEMVLQRKIPGEHLFVYKFYKQLG